MPTYDTNIPAQNLKISVTDNIQGTDLYTHVETKRLSARDQGPHHSIGHLQVSLGQLGRWCRPIVSGEVRENMRGFDMSYSQTMLATGY